jgi:hypothetical protein
MASELANSATSSPAGFTDNAPANPRSLSPESDRPLNGAGLLGWTPSCFWNQSPSGAASRALETPPPVREARGGTPIDAPYRSGVKLMNAKFASHVLMLT